MDFFKNIQTQLPSEIKKKKQNILKRKKYKGDKTFRYNENEISYSEPTKLLSYIFNLII